MKILLLEDNTSLCDVIKDVLTQHGYDVRVFNDGEQALEELNKGYHCFIIDINVPSLDGISILESIRLFNKEVPVIIISSNHDLEKIQASYEIGCNDYLKKPFFIYELVHKIKKLCHIEASTVELWKGYLYDFKNQRLFNPQKEEIFLGRKEYLFLDLFIKDTTRTVPFFEIDEYVWQGEETTIFNIRALVKRLRSKLPEGAIKTIKEVGYRLDSIVENKPF